MNPGLYMIGKITGFYFMFAVSVIAQNSDLLMKYHSGYYTALGGTGYAAAKYASSLDLNPAVLSNYSSMQLSVSQSITYYDYGLVRISSTVGGQSFDWNKTLYNFEQASVVVPVNNKISIGAGLYRKINPQLFNKKRAVTFSDLFTQETYGNVYSAAAALSYQLIKPLAFGISVNKYFGTLNSKITGDNHGNDADKWASMKNDLSGVNFKCVLLLVDNDWSAGLIFETPFKMKVKTSNQISLIELYKYLLPKYDETEWNQPMVVGAGVSYYGINSFLFEADFEIRKYKSSNVQINLYEFGGSPVWQDIKIFRAGIQYKPDDWPLPIKIGYAYIPQLYYSNNSIGISNTISSYQNTDQNIKQNYTAGTSVRLEKFSIDITIRYSVIKWKRTLLIPQKITDDFTEGDTVLSVGVAYSL